MWGAHDCHAPRRAGHPVRRGIRGSRKVRLLLDRPLEPVIGRRFGPTRWRTMTSQLPLAINKALHQPVWLVGQERLPEYADAEVDGFLERQLFPLAGQGFLRTPRLPTPLEQGFYRALDRGIQ